MAFIPSLRTLINIVLGEAQAPWGISRTALFNETMARHMRVFPNLDEKLLKFIETKLENPIVARYGKHDRPFTGPLVGFWHAHLRDDAIIVYNLANRCINLVAIVSHAEIEGKQAAKTGKRLKQYLV